MKNRFVLGLAVLLAAAAPVGLLQEAPVAVMMKVDGDVRLAQAGAEPRAAAVGARLQDGDRVIPASGARAVVVYRTGQKREITEEVTIATPESADRGDAFERTVGVLAQAANSNARTSPNRQGMIRPLPGAPTKVAPRLGIKVESTRPTFVWRDYEGGARYRVQVRQAGSRPVRYETGDTAFTLPEGAELTPGAMVYWTVSRASTPRAEPEDSAMVMSLEEKAALATNLHAIAELGFDPQEDGRLLAAVIFTDMGLYYAAADLLDDMAAWGPVSADVLMLKGEVMDRLGLVDEARIAFDEADARIR